MIDVTEILVHWHAGRSLNEMSGSLGVDRKTIRKYVAPAIAAGITPGGPARGEFATWIKDTVEHPGSWWPDWAAWLAEQAPQVVPARTPGEGKLTALGEAPGDYVKVKA